MKTIILLPIIIGISLHSYARELDNPKTNYATPVANAGADRTIYLTQTNTATLDGSASTGTSFQWEEFSSDYESGATITSPTSKVTTVTGLPQGVFYFRIKATSGGTSVYDSMKVIVDYDVPPRNAHLTRHIPFDEPEFVAKINARTDTSNYLGYVRANKYYEPHDIAVKDVQGTKLFYIERGRSNGFRVDNMQAKLYATIEDGYAWGTAKGVTGQTYARSQITYNSQTWGVDTNTTYVYTLKFYFPQSVKDNFATDPDWGRIAMSGMHGNDDGSGCWQTSLGRNEMYFTDNNAGKEISMGNSDNFVNQTHTLRVITREGSAYPNQKAFIKAELDGVEIYSDYTGKMGKTLMEDYQQTTGLYDYRRLIVDPDNHTRNKKFSLVTQSTDIYAINPWPTVNAGQDKTTSENSVNLSGTADDLGVSGNGKIVSYRWTKISGGAATISSPNSASTSVTGLENGTYEFKLTATDDSGISGDDTIRITVNSQEKMPPVADVGEDRIIDLPKNSIVLPGSGTSNGGTIVSYEWKQLSGPSAGRITDADSAKAGVWDLIAGTYQFQLTVKDNQGLTGSKILNVVVNPASNTVPTVNAGNDQTIKLPTNSVTLSGSGTDEDGTIAAYAWTKIAGPNSGTINNANSSSATVNNLSEGTYQFELKVTDNKGAIAKDTVQVKVTEAENIAPTANAGNNQTIKLPTNAVTLTGSGTDEDGTIASYQWTKIAGPSSFTIADQKSATTKISNLSEGTYQFELKVTDNKGAIAKDTVQVKVTEAENIAPTANAGNNQTIKLPTNAATLSGSGIDEDGTIASYQWTKIAGPSSFTIADQKLATTKISNLSEGTYQFELKVTDNKGAIARDTVQVKVTEAENIAPTANAGNNQTIKLPTNSVTLTGSGTDEDGTIASYGWTKISGPNSGTINNANSSSATVNNLSEGTYQFELKVTDNKAAIARDTVQVKVTEAENIAPTANAGNNQTIKLPTNFVTLTGSGTDADGTIASYGWTKISGPNSGTINNANSSSATVNNLSEGTYQFELKVTDNKGAIARDTVQVKVTEAENIAPTANAGNNQTIKLPTSSVTLSGRGTDEDGTIASYAWTKIAGPNSGTINNANSSSATVNNLSEGTYQFELKVTDNKGAIARDTVQVKVTEAENIAPTVNAGNDQTVKLPTNSVTLTGSGTDEDGTIASYAWTKISGPSSFTIADQKSATTKISNLSEGTYQFELKVTDNKGAIARDTVQVKVTEAENIAPTVNVGNDQTVKLPTNSVTLTGSGTDEDGTIASYAWTKVAGPNSGTINNANSSSATVNNLSEGTYQFELKVTDNKGAIARDTVQVKVTEAENIAPTANAGNNQTIKLPTNAATLSGSGIDEDGTIASYQWTKIAGPSSFTIADQKSATTKISNLSEGTYQFQLKVTDNKGAIAKDTVQVKVTEAENIAPTVNAGNDQTIKLPTSSVTLSGSGTDEDGSIASYQWTKISGPSSFTIVNSSSAVTTVSGLQQGVYQFELKVIDNKGAIGRDTLKISVNAPNNVAPTANAGADKMITLPVNSVILSGTGSDSDGHISAYSWTKISGPSSFSIKNSSSATSQISELVKGVYQFEFKVTDNRGDIGKDTIQVTVRAAENIRPTATAGSNQTITLPTNTITLHGSGEDSDGTITAYLWTKISGPSTFDIANAGVPVATASNLVEGSYQFELKVTDNNGAVAKDTVQVTVNKSNLTATPPAVPANATPVANAGNNQTIILPATSVTLSGSGTDKDGTIASYQWTKISGPGSGTINNANSSSATVSNLSEGTYQFELKVTDDQGAIGKDTVNVTVNEAANVAPVANAGKDTTILYPASTVLLNGQGIDVDGEVASYKWKQISGPSQSIIKSDNTISPEMSELKEGTYEYELEVTDSKGAIGKDSVKVTVALGRVAPEINNSITVYPNPVHDVTTADINTGRANTNVLITISDMSGKTFYQKQVVSISDNIKVPIDMSNFGKGTYVITIFFDNVMRKSIKVVKL